MMEYLLIPIAAICNRVRGGGVIPLPEKLPRKMISGILLATIASLLYNFTRLDSSYIQAASVAGIVLMGWYARNVVGTGMLFNAIHGWTAPKWKGIVYGTARGLLTLATTIPLAWVEGNMYLSLWGLLGSLQGVLFYLSGIISEKTSIPAVTLGEALDGALFGVILFAILRST